MPATQTIEEVARIGETIGELDGDTPAQLRNVRSVRVEVQELHQQFEGAVDAIRRDPDLSESGAGKRVSQLAANAAQRLATSKVKAKQVRDALEIMGRKDAPRDPTVAAVDRLRTDLLLDRLSRLDEGKRLDLLLNPDREVARAVLGAAEWVRQELGVRPEMLERIEEATLSPDVAATVRRGRRELAWLESEIAAYEKVLPSASGSDPIVEAAG